MIRNIFVIKVFVAVSFFCISTIHTYAGQSTDIKLTVSNITTIKGNLRIGIYTSQNKFNEDRPNFNNGSSYRGLEIKVTSSIMVIEIKDLPKGDYMIAVFQDVNENQLFDSTQLGIPLEPYGFSNNARALFGPPSFKQAKFTYAGRFLSLNIKIK